MEKRAITLLAFLTLTLILILTGCQHKAPTEEELWSSLNGETLIYVNGTEHYLSLDDITIFDSTVENDFATVDLSYSMSDAFYRQTITGSFDCYYDDGWTITSYGFMPDSELSYIGENFPEELDHELGKWADLWNTDDTTALENWTKVGDGEIDVVASVSNEIHPLVTRNGTSSFVCRLGHSMDVSSTDIDGRSVEGGLGPNWSEAEASVHYQWYFQETERNIKDQWNIAGTYNVTAINTYWKSATIEIESFDPDTCLLHIKSAVMQSKDDWYEGPTTWTLSDVDIEMHKQYTNWYEGLVDYGHGAHERIRITEDTLTYDQKELVKQ